MSEFGKDFNTIQDAIKLAVSSVAPDPQERKQLLRSSSLPYCPLREFYEHITDTVEPQEMSFSKKFYTSMGTTVHDTVQNWLPKFFDKLEAIGSWDAEKMGCGVLEEDCPCSNGQVLGLDSKGCPACGLHPPYEELQSVGEYTSHVDHVFRVKDTNRVYIIDTKTTSTKKVWHYNKTGEGFPQKNYIHQLDSYAVAFYDKIKDMDYELYGTAILYIPRDDFRQWVMVPVRKTITEEWIMKVRNRLHRVTQGYRHVSDIIENDKWDMESANLVHSHKLCKTEGYYLKHVEDTYNKCPLADVCFEKGKLRERLKEAIANRENDG